MKSLLAYRVLMAIQPGTPGASDQTPDTQTPSAAVAVPSTNNTSTSGLLPVGTTPSEACWMELNRMNRRTGGNGGVVCIGPDGRPGLAHTTEKMAWAICQRAELTAPELGGEAQSFASQYFKRQLQCGIDSSEAPSDLCVSKTSFNGP